MSKEQVQDLKDKIFGKKSKIKTTGITNIMDAVRQFSCLDSILGRNFEVRDAAGKLVYTIRQKPIALKQLNTILKELEILKNLDAEAEAKKFGSKKGSGKRLGKR